MQKEAIYRQTQSNDPEVIAAAIVTGGVIGSGSGLLDALRGQVPRA